MSLSTSALAVSFLAIGSPVRAEAVVHLEAAYEITFAGLPAGLENVTADIALASYEIHAETRTRGVPELLVHFRSAALAIGTFAEGVPHPERHDAINRWRGKDRHVHLSYAGNTVSADVAPDAAHDERDPVAPEEWPATVDPITASWRLMQGAAQGCSASVQVFDGRRRYDLVEQDGGAKDTRGGLAGPAQICRIAYVDLGGRSHNPWWPRSREPKKAEVWFRNLDPRLPPIAVLATGHAGPMPIAIRLSRLTIDGKALIGEENSESAAIPPGH